MDFIYSVDLNSYLSCDEIKTSDLCSCALSNQNILAFANDCCVYILPLEKPNELIPVNLNSSPCVYLAWSDDGSYLLNICKNGVANLYNVKTNILNTIDPVFSFRINKDDFISTKPFSKLSKLCLDHSKQHDAVSYFEKFVHKSFDCLKNLSRLAFNGFLILTKRGKIQLCLTDFNTVKKKYEIFDFDMKLSVGEIDNGMDCGQGNGSEIFYELGDFSYESDGSINVAYTNTDIVSPICIYKMTIHFNNDNSALEGSTELIAKINLNQMPNVIKPKLLFTSNEMSNTLCIQLRNQQTNTDILQFWQTPKDTYDGLINQMCMWSMQYVIQCDSQISSLKIPKNETNFKDFRSGDRQEYRFFLLAAYTNGQIGYIDTVQFNQTFLSAIQTKKEQLVGSYQNDAKKLKSTCDEYLVTLDQSFSNLAGVGITNKCNLLTFRQPYFRATQFSVDFPIQKVTNLYEFSMLTGNDFWDLLATTSPRYIEPIIENLDANFSNQIASVGKAYFSRFYSLIFALSRRSISSTKKQSKSLDILAKLVLNRTISIFAYSIQLNLNIEALTILFANSNPNLINTQASVPLINTNLITNNLDYINSQTTSNSPANGFNQIPLKNNLSDYFTEILKLDTIGSSFSELKLMEITQSILNRKNTSLVVSWQLRHLGQWMIEMALSLVEATMQVHRMDRMSDVEPDFFGNSLLKDLDFLNQVRKGLLFVKLLFSLNESGQIMPVLPYRSMGYQKDLIAELFSIVTKLIHKVKDKHNSIDDSLMEQCTSVQSDTIHPHLDKKLFNLRHSWFGESSHCWLKTYQLPVDYLFDEERPRIQYPLFDIVRLIQFSRSSLTKQCIRCGNFTEANSLTSHTQPQTNSLKSQSCMLMQDLCGNKCICGGSWVFSPIQ